MSREINKRDDLLGPSVDAYLDASSKEDELVPGTSGGGAIRRAAG